jgi:hypothetical protein
MSISLAKAGCIGMDYRAMKEWRHHGCTMMVFETDKHCSRKGCRFHDYQIDKTKQFAEVVTSRGQEQEGG